MFKDNIYFMSNSELNSWNRVNGAPGARFPSQKDHQRISNMMDCVGDPDILRTESGVKPVSMRHFDN